ncbi:hypothetical protein [Streptomyces sp. NPDC021212]|uniref:hypothetical protein n=1 Tax=Streptomyces sp. NPDC021212 TaxID=3365118 RepID=UPI0037935546
MLKEVERGAEAAETWDPDQFVEHIKVLHRLLQHVELSPLDRYTGERYLGTLLLRLHLLNTNTEALDWCIELFRSAANFGTGISRVADLSALAGALMQRFWASGDVAELDESISLHRALRKTVLSAPLEPKPSPRELVSLLLKKPGLSRNRRLEALDWTLETGIVFGASSLADALYMRFLFFRQISDLEEAITYVGEAIDRSRSTRFERERPGEAKRDRGKFLSNLGHYYVERFETLRRSEDLDAAVGCVREADALLPPGDRESTMLARNYVRALTVRGRVNSTLADYDEAARLLDKRDPEGTVWETVVQLHLGRAALNGSEEDLAVAVGRLQDVMASVEAGEVIDGPHRARVLTLLAGALEQQVAALGQAPSASREAMLGRAEAAWREAALLPDAAAWYRLRAAQGWAALTMRERPGSADAVDACAVAVEILPIAAWRGLDRVSQERVLTEAGEHLATDAAAALTASGAPERAIELLELGRGVLWSHGLDTQTDLQALRARYPDLADQLTRVRVLLEGA